MFNRNGSNNGNGYGVHKDTALVVQNDPASSVGQELLLWDGLSPAVANSLGQPLDPALVSHRKGPRRTHLRLPRRPRRHRPSQPHILLWGMGL